MQKAEKRYEYENMYIFIVLKRTSCQTVALGYEGEEDDYLEPILYS